MSPCRIDRVSDADARRVIWVTKVSVGLGAHVGLACVADLLASAGVGKAIGAVEGDTSESSVVEVQPGMHMLVLRRGFPRGVHGYERLNGRIQHEGYGY